MTFTLNTKLATDTLNLGTLADSQLLLMKNASYPWFILVPHSCETEFHRLSPAQQQRCLAQVNLLSAFIEKTFPVDKLNIATIGNVVSQLHIHVIGRSHSDPCWPNVVWGNPASKAYSEAEIASIRKQLPDALGDEFIPY